MTIFAEETTGTTDTFPPSDEVVTGEEYSAPNNEDAPAADDTTSSDDFADLDTAWNEAMNQGAGEEQPQTLPAVNFSVRVQAMPIDTILPSGLNPRKRIDEAKLDDLVASIRQVGIKQPITVRPSRSVETYFEIVMGERRWHAARLAGMTEVPVIVDRTLSDADVASIALTENMQRADLTPIEEARGMQRILDLTEGLSQIDLAKSLGLPQPTVSNRLRLLKLPSATIGMIDRGDLSPSHGVALAGIADNPEVVDRIATQAQQGGWTQSRIEEEVKTFKAAQEAARHPALPGLVLEAPASTSVPIVDNPKPTTTPAPITTSAPPAATPTAEKPTPPQTAAPATKNETVAAPSASPTPAAAASETVTPAPSLIPAPTTETVTAPDGPRIATSISAATDDWLFEQDLTIDQALAELMAYRVSAKAREAMVLICKDRGIDSPALVIEGMILFRAANLGLIDPATSASSDEATQE
jgi:ParB family chromosome partitioning protein